MARPKTDIEPRIVNSARVCFARAGVDGSSLRQIAKGAKTSIGMVYYYFPTKDDLFHAVVEEVYSELLAGIEQALAGDAPADERILRLYLRIGAASDLELLTLRLVFQEMLVSPVRRAQLLERFKRGHLALVRQALIDGVRLRRLRADRNSAVMLLSTLALGAVPQLVIRALGASRAFGEAPAGKALASELLAVWLHGMSANPEAKVSTKKQVQRR